MSANNKAKEEALVFCKIIEENSAVFLEEKNNKNWRQLSAPCELVAAIVCTLSIQPLHQFPRLFSARAALPIPYLNFKKNKFVEYDVPGEQRSDSPQQECKVDQITFVLGGGLQIIIPFFHLILYFNLNLSALEFGRRRRNIVACGRRSH